MLGGVRGGGAGRDPRSMEDGSFPAGPPEKSVARTPQGLYFGLRTLHPTPPLRRESAPPPAPPAGAAASLLAEPSGEPPAG